MSQPSLLSFLDTPVVVGDPDGRAAYVNPAFETRFSVSAEEVTGEPLANLFEGGVREAVLTAVAAVCTGAPGVSSTTKRTAPSNAATSRLTAMADSRALST